MTDEELRAIVRDVIAARGLAPAATSPPEPARGPHPSFGRFHVLPGRGSDACLIEPAVRCTHCGYCESYGH